MTQFFHNEAEAPFKQSASLREKWTRIRSFLRKILKKFFTAEDLADNLELESDLITPEFIKILGEQIPYYNDRLLVKPCLTGWAQINYPYGSSIDDAMVKLQYDLFYIKNRSFTLDISIILKTINTVLNRSLGQ